MAGAAAVRDFGATLDALGESPTPDQALAAAPELDASLGRAELVAQRLDAATLADQRLEQQREAVAAAYATVAMRMEDVVREAEAARPRRMATAAASYQEAVDALRDQAGSPSGS